MSSSETPITTRNGEIRQTSTVTTEGNTTVSVFENGHIFIRVDPNRDTRLEGSGGAERLVGNAEDTTLWIRPNGEVSFPNTRRSPSLTPEQIASIGSLEQVQAMGRTLLVGGTLNDGDMSRAAQFALTARSVGISRWTTPAAPQR